jgi:hypothetical protein
LGFAFSALRVRTQPFSKNAVRTVWRSPASSARRSVRISPAPASAAAASATPFSALTNVRAYDSGV